MTKGKIIYCTIMTLVFCIMTLGYAALQQRIDIQGEATVDSTYRVEITSVGQGTVVGDARSTTAPQYNGLNASFYVGLTNTTDTITYNIEITNYSTVDVKLNNIDISVDGTNNFEIIKKGIRHGDIMLAGSIKNIELKVKYTGSNQSSEQTGTVTLNFNFTRLKGGTGNVTVDNIYAIGESITYAGSKWYVIDDSSTNKDYVTLLKDDVLTATEIGNDYSIKTDGVAQPYMAYYWSRTCHNSNSYGSDSYSVSASLGCIGHDDYTRSKIKEVVDNYMSNYLDETNLKEVDGYKIRLLTKDEIINNLGWVSGPETSDLTQGNSVPTWLLKTDLFYWTMTKEDGTIYVHVYMLNQNPNDATGKFKGTEVDASGQVRPVINLLKSAISNNV